MQKTFILSFPHMHSIHCLFTRGVDINMETASARHCKVYALAAYLLTHLFMFHFSFAGVLNHFPIAARKNYNEVIFYKEYLSLKVKTLRSIVCLTLSCLPANAGKKPFPNIFGMKPTPKVFRGLVL